MEQGNGTIKIYNIGQFVFIAVFDGEGVAIMSDCIDSSRTNACRSTLELMERVNHLSAAPYKMIYNPMSNGFNNNKNVDVDVCKVITSIYNNASMIQDPEVNKYPKSTVIHNKELSDYAYYINEKTKELIVGIVKDMYIKDGNNLEDINSIEDLLNDPRYFSKVSMEEVELEYMYHEEIDSDLTICGKIGSNTISDLPDSGFTVLIVYDSDTSNDVALGEILMIYTGECIAIDVRCFDNPDARLSLDINLALDIIKELGEEYRLETMIINKAKEKEKEYLKYIDTHISKVQKVFEKHGKELCMSIGANYDSTAAAIEDHDTSKYSEEEFNGYRAEFYPYDEEDNKSERVKREFKKAWLHHIHCNAHHPEHWILIDDDGSRVIFDMPPEEIVCMICDWESFRKDDGSGGAYHFYYNVDNKENLLSDYTRILLERALEVVNK